MEVKPFHFGRPVRRPRLHRKAYVRYRLCQAGVLLHPWPCFRHTYFNSISARTEPVAHSPTAPFARSAGAAGETKTTPTTSTTTQHNDRGDIAITLRARKDRVNAASPLRFGHRNQCHGSDELPLSPERHRALALHLVAPVVAVLRLDPSAPTRDVATRAARRDDTFRSSYKRARKLPVRLSE
jgi:hypothetical protein